MKINAINNTSANTSFKGIVNIDPKAIKTVIGDKLNEFEILSDAKGINVIPLRAMGGCMVNRDTGYIVMLQEKDGSIVKEFKCSSENKEDLEKLNKKVEECLIWAEAPSNYYVATILEKSNLAKENPKFTALLTELLYKTASSSEAAIWRERIDRIV